MMLILGETKKITLGASNYGRLTISPGLWVAFKGKRSGENLIANVASIEHDPNEAEQRDQTYLILFTTNAANISVVTVFLSLIIL